MTYRATSVFTNRYASDTSGLHLSPTCQQTGSIKRWIVPCLIFISLMKPSGFEDISWLAPVNYCLIVMQICSFFYAVWLYLRQPISLTVVLILTMHSLYAFPAVLQENFAAILGSDSLNFVKTIVMVMIVESYISRKEGRTLLYGFAYASLFLLVANLLVTFVFNPSGLYSGFSDGVYGECFLGNKNTVRNPLLIGFVCCVLLDASNGKRTSRLTLALIAIGLINLTLVWSATALVVFVMACVLYCLSLADIHIPGIETLELAAAVSWFVVVVFRKIDLFQHFITDVLQKDMTFSGRTIMWDCAFDSIAQNPFLGQGLGSYLTYWNINNPFLQVPHCHNAFVDAMYKGGIIALAVLLLLIAKACCQLQRASNQQIRIGLTITVAAYLFMGIFGELLNPCFMAVLAIASRVKELEEEMSNGIVKFGGPRYDERTR